MVEFGSDIDRHVSALVLALAERIEQAGLRGVVETVPTFRSLMIHYDPQQIRQAQLKERLIELLQDLNPSETAGRLWRIPACYDPSLGPDLEDVASRTGLSVPEVIRLHTSATYHVYMLGFLPGYPYMGGLPAELVLPRRQNPRIKVPAGALAIAMSMAAIYPLESPGGWHLLGRTPVPLWDLRRDPPALLQPGDKVQFVPIPLDQYEELVREAEAGSLRLEPEVIAATGAQP